MKLIEILQYNHSRCTSNRNISRRNRDPINNHHIHPSLFPAPTRMPSEPREQRSQRTSAAVWALNLEPSGSSAGELRIIPPRDAGWREGAPAPRPVDSRGVQPPPKIAADGPRQVFTRERATPGVPRPPGSEHSEGCVHFGRRRGEGQGRVERLVGGSGQRAKRKSQGSCAAMRGSGEKERQRR